MNGELLTEAFRKIRARFAGTGRGDDDVIDSLQDAFCRLWSQRDRIPEKNQAEILLSHTARNIRIDQFRRKARHPQTDLDSLEGIPDNDSSPDEAGELFPTIDRLVRTSISPRDREILYLRDRDGWEYEDLARRFNLSESNTRMIVSRSRKLIRELYRKHTNNI